MAVPIVARAGAGPLGRPAPGAVYGHDQVEIGVVEIDPGIQDSHVCIYAPVVSPINIQTAVVVGEYPFDAGGQLLSVDGVCLVWLNQDHSPIAGHCRCLFLRGLDHRTTQGMTVDAAHLHSVSLPQAMGNRIRVLVSLKDHDVSARLHGLGHRRPGQDAEAKGDEQERRQ